MDEVRDVTDKRKFLGRVQPKSPYFDFRQSHDENVIFSATTIHSSHFAKTTDRTYTPYEISFSFVLVTFYS
jgi:hypothetical protein